MVGAGLTLGTGFGSFYATWLWDMCGNWRDCIVNGGWLWLVIIMLYLILAKDAPGNLYEADETEASVQESNSSLKNVSVWKQPTAWLCTGALFCVCWMCCGFQTMLPSYMADLGYTTDQSGIAMLWNGLIGLALTPIGGALSEAFISRGMNPLKARAYCMAFVGFLVTAVSLVLCPFMAPMGFVAVMVVSLLHGAGGPVANASIGALPLDLLGDRALADKMFGMTCLIGLSGGIIAPLVVAVVMESAGWTAAMVVTAAGAFAGVLIGIAMPAVKARMDKKTSGLF